MAINTDKPVSSHYLNNYEYLGREIMSQPWYGSWSPEWGKTHTSEKYTISTTDYTTPTSPITADYSFGIQGYKDSLVQIALRLMENADKIEPDLFFEILQIIDEKIGNLVEETT